jgi:hypothetical protein
MASIGGISMVFSFEYDDLGIFVDVVPSFSKLCNLDIPVSS